jgi:hypothetical protein
VSDVEIPIVYKYFVACLIVRGLGEKLQYLSEVVSL